MKIKDILNKKDEVLLKDVEDMKKKLQELRFKLSIREEKNVKSIKAIKKDIARIKTIITEREILKEEESK